MVFSLLTYSQNEYMIALYFTRGKQTARKQTRMKSIPVDKYFVPQSKYITGVKYDAREIPKEGDAKMYEKFKALLDEKHITTYQFCKDTGISESTVAMWKARNTSVSVKHLRTLSEYFGVEIEYFIS